MLKRIRDWLRTTAHFHLREERVASLDDLVDLIDRFIDDRMAYDWEWDDFISWKHENPNIEVVRDKIAATEPLFFSLDTSIRRQAIERLVQERNRAAALIGRAARGYP